MSNGLPPSPPGAPPKPPPRRPPSPPTAEQVHNPFMVPEATPQAPTPGPEQGSNPFLAEPPTPAAVRSPSAPRVVPPSQGAPLRSRPGAESPQVRDAHAEFRKGSWKKPLAFVLIAAALGAGLLFGLPQPEPEKPNPFADAEAEQQTVIGASVSPAVILDPDRPSLQNPKPERRVKTQEELEQEQPPAAPDRTDRSDGFADAFKSTAK